MTQPLLPQKYSPIQINGNGNQKCYLAEISSDMASILLEIAESENNGAGQVVDTLRESIDEDKEEDHINRATEITETEREQIIKARRGQGLFRLRVERIEKACRVTGVNDKSLLVASHIKPWRKSSNTEKLDGNNGLLLSPHVDKLFDRGLISFLNNGRILYANKDVKKVMELWGLDVNKNVGKFNEKQKNYLAFHRKYIYKLDV